MESNNDTPKIPDTADQMQRLFATVREMRIMLEQVVTRLEQVVTDAAVIKKDISDFRVETTARFDRLTAELHELRDDFRQVDKQVSRDHAKQVDIIERVERLESHVDDLETRKQ